MPQWTTFVIKMGKSFFGFLSLSQYVFAIVKSDFEEQNENHVLFMICKTMIVVIENYLCIQNALFDTR